MRHLALLATGAFLIAASGPSFAGPVSPAGLSRVDGPPSIELVRDKPKSEPLTKKVKRVWRDLTGGQARLARPDRLQVQRLLSGVPRS